MDIRDDKETFEMDSSTLELRLALAVVNISGQSIDLIQRELTSIDQLMSPLVSCHSAVPISGADACDALPLTIEGRGACTPLGQSPYGDEGLAAQLHATRRCQGLCITKSFACRERQTCPTCIHHGQIRERWASRPIALPTPIEPY
jgi:hypothetical protein